MVVKADQKVTLIKPHSGLPTRKLSVNKIMQGLRRAVTSLNQASKGRQVNILQFPNHGKSPSTTRPAT